MTPPLERCVRDEEEEESMSVVTEAACQTIFESDSNFNSNWNSNAKGKAESLPPLSPTTTFWNDVRQEWIDSVFRPDFFPLSEEGQDNDDNNEDGRINDDELKVRQGVGVSNIPHYHIWHALDSSADRVALQIHIPNHIDSERIANSRIVDAFLE